MKGAPPQKAGGEQGSPITQNPWLVVVIATVLGGCILYLLSRISRMDKAVNRMEREQQHALQPSELRDAVGYFMRENPEEILLGCTPYLQRMLLRYPYLYTAPVQRVICDTLPHYMNQYQGVLEQSVLSNVQARLATAPAPVAYVQEPVGAGLQGESSPMMTGTSTNKPGLRQQGTQQKGPPNAHVQSSTITIARAPITVDSAPFFFAPCEETDGSSTDAWHAHAEQGATHTEQGATHTTECNDYLSETDSDCGYSQQYTHDYSDHLPAGHTSTGNKQHAIHLSAHDILRGEKLQLDACPVVDATALNGESAQDIFAECLQTGQRISTAQRKQSPQNLPNPVLEALEEAHMLLFAPPAEIPYVMAQMMNLPLYEDGSAPDIDASSVTEIE